TGVRMGVTEAIRILEPHLAHGVMQCIATGTPAGQRSTIEKAEALARHFEVLPVLPPTEEEALQIVSSIKEDLEKFHGITIGEGALEMALKASGRFLRERQLPDRVLDLLDEAGARAKMRRETEPAQIIEVRQRIHFARNGAGDC